MCCWMLFEERKFFHLDYHTVISCDILIGTYASLCLEHFVGAYPCGIVWMRKLAFCGNSTWDRWCSRQSFGRTKVEADSREVDLTSSRRMPREVGGDEDDLGIVGDQLVVFFFVPTVDDSCTRNFNAFSLILVAEVLRFQWVLPFWWDKRTRFFWGPSSFVDFDKRMSWLLTTDSYRLFVESFFLFLHLNRMRYD